MIRHYFLSSIRTLRQNPLYTALSVFGIALTFVFVSVVFLIVKSVNDTFIPSKYAERTWTLQYIEVGNTTRNIFKNEVDTWVPKMTAPETILITTHYQIETVVMNDRNISVNKKGVCENYFDVCRFKFLRGRPVNKQEIAESIPVAVIDRHTANQYFGKNQDPVGNHLEMNGIQYRVVGVVENISFFNEFTASIAYSNVWVPYGTVKDTEYPVSYNISFTARDKSSIADIQAEFTRVLDEINTAEDQQYSIPVWQRSSLKEQSVFTVEIGLLALFILLLIPALNILSLNMSNSYGRSEEFAIRKAFGAPKRTVFTQLFVENTLLTLAGAVVGMCITPPLIRAIDQMMLGISVEPMALSLHFDWVSVLFIAGPCVLLFSFLTGSIPTWMTVRRDVVTVLKGDVHTTGLFGNRKRSLAWIFIEQSLVFGVMLFCFTYPVEYIVLRLSKGNITYDNIAVVNFKSLDTSRQEDDDALHFRNMMTQMREWESVEMVSINRTGAIPPYNYRFGDTVSFDARQYIRANVRYCDENYYRMFLPKLSDGDWFRDSDALSDMPGAVVTQKLADNAGVTGSAVGQTIYFRGRTYRIAGIVEAFKNDPNGDQLATLFLPALTVENEMGLTGCQYAVKFKRGMGDDFSKTFFAEFYRNFSRERFQPVYIDLPKVVSQDNFIDFSSLLYFTGIPLAFLLIFAFMGTFGVIWTQSKKRMSEFGLRIAFGCTPMRLMRKIIFENLTLTTLAMLPGLIVVAFLYAYAPKGWEWTVAVGAAIVLMWLFSVVSACYPAWKAGKVAPVEALKANQ